MFGITAYAWIVIIGYSMWPLIGVGCLAIGAHCGREDGYEDGRADAREAQLGENRAGTPRPGRHERTQPPRQPATQLERDQPEPERAPWYLPPPGPIRSHTSAGKTGPVFIPGPDHPQPGRDSGSGTVTMPRYGTPAALPALTAVRPRLALPATTGEMAAITDQYIADMQAQEAADRERRRLALTAGGES